MEENKKALSGRPPSIIDFNIFLYGQMDPDCPVLTPKEREAMWNLSKPTIPNIGQVMIFSTAGESSNNFFKNIWDGTEKL